MSIDANDHRGPARRRRLRIGPPVRPALAIVTVAALAAVLAACGSSTSTATNAAASSTTPSRPGAPGAGRFAALRSCLQQQGIKLSARPGPAGQGPGSYGRRPGGRFKAPPGVSEARFREALGKCGAGNLRGRGNLSNPATVAALTKYATCMREHGIDLPAPNTKGTGPIFDTSGIDTSSAAFRAAREACRADLPSAFGPGGGHPPAGAPAS